MLPNSAFSDQQLQAICETAHVIACECPARLVNLLRSIRAFRQDTIECIQIVPEETATHQWLSAEILQIETLLSQVTVEFMRREDLLDKQQQLDFKKLAERNRQAALRQQQFNRLNASDE